MYVLAPHGARHVCVRAGCVFDGRFNFFHGARIHTCHVYFGLVFVSPVFVFLWLGHGTSKNTVVFVAVLFFPFSYMKILVVLL